MRAAVRVARLLIGAGVVCLPLSLAALMRGDGSPLVWLAAGIVLIAVGLVVHRSSNRRLPAAERREPQDVTMVSPGRRRSADVVSWVAFLLYLVVSVSITVWVISTGRDPAGLIIVWPLALFLAIGPIRSLHARAERRRGDTDVSRGEHPPAEHR